MLETFCRDVVCNGVGQQLGDLLLCGGVDVEV